MSRRRRVATACAALALGLAFLPVACLARTNAPAAAAAVATEAPAALNVPGLPNAFRVSAGLYRGAQPEKEGFPELAKLGIRTVVNLRAHHSDEEFLKGLGLAYESIPINTWALKEDDAARFLAIVSDTNRTPVFVHCQHGADRTGTMCAVYRMAVCGWTRERALDEMVNGGFGFHKTWQNLVEFVKTVDVESVRKRAGLSAEGAGAPASLP